jgi:hypothetical protein
MIVKTCDSVQATESTPCLMDNRLLRFLELCFRDKTDDHQKITGFEYSVSTAGNQIFAGLELGDGNRYYILSRCMGRN